MTRRLLLSYLAVASIALALLAVPLGITIGHREKERLLFNIERDADAMAAIAGGPVASPHSMPRLELLQYAARTGGHVIVVDVHGRARLDTDRPDDPGRDYSTRPEIRQALRGNRVEGTRRSETLKTTLVYTAVPITANGRVSGVVRITYPTATLDDRVRKIWAQLALLCVGVLMAAAGVGFVLARSLTRPLRNLERATDRLAEGDLGARVSAGGGPPELRRLAETFNRMAERLAGLVEAQQSFVADASHQLRTPLTALRLRLENLEASAVPADRAALDAANDEVARMSRLVDELLMLARGADNDVRVVFDVVPVARGRVEMWAEVADEREVRVTFEGPASAPVSAIQGAVEQLVDNLVDNALAVSPAGSTIVVRLDVASSGRVELHVLDSGPGLPPEDRAHAFDRFWRGERSAPGGSGLGLAIARQLAEACGGTARLDARDGGGIDAVVTLTAAQLGAGAKS